MLQRQFWDQINIGTDANCSYVALCAPRKTSDWDSRVSVILLAVVLPRGASCSNKGASCWARTTCCLLFSAVSVCLLSLFNICGLLHSLSLPPNPLQRHHFVSFICIPCSQPLPSIFFSSSSLSVIHHRLALCQSVMHIRPLLLLMKCILLLLSAPAFTLIFVTRSFPCSRVTLCLSNSVFLPPLCVLGICSHIINLWLTSTPPFVSTRRLIRVNLWKNTTPVKAFEMNAEDFLSFKIELVWIFRTLKQRKKKQSVSIRPLLEPFTFRLNSQKSIRAIRTKAICTDLRVRSEFCIHPWTCGSANIKRVDSSDRGALGPGSDLERTRSSCPWLVNEEETACWQPR